MKKENYLSLPICYRLSFKKLLQRYEELVDSDEQLTALKAKYILELAEKHPELRTGFDGFDAMGEAKQAVDTILEDAFPTVLTHNEIKALTLPFRSELYHPSQRLQKILKNAGTDYDLTLRMGNDEFMYTAACIIVLISYYGYQLDFKRPFFYDIPDDNGIMRHYRLLYNADFVEVIPTEKAIPITEADVDELLDNFDNIEMWKSKFPPDSYMFNGFILCNLFDVTSEHSISEIKSNLIANASQTDDTFIERFERIFRSLFNIPDLKVGFVRYDSSTNSFYQPPFSNDVKSYLLYKVKQNNCDDALCKGSYEMLLKDNKIFSVSDVDKYNELSGGMLPYSNLKEQGIKSAIFAPVVDGDELLGVAELVSFQPKKLNSINAVKFLDIMPIIETSVKRSIMEEENLIEAVIQEECTSIHESVVWKFEEEALKFLEAKFNGEEARFNKIAFDDIYPLFGQIDIKGSSDARNEAIKEDLIIQLTRISGILQALLLEERLPIYEQIQYQTQNYLQRLQDSFQVDSEQSIINFVNREINPLFDHINKQEGALSNQVTAYYDALDKDIGIIYDHRKNYDQTVMEINEKMARFLDKKQDEAQAMFPHYFERFKTDGVEHNMYIGASISKTKKFDKIYLYNLRLWQLQVMCEMENKYYQIQSNFPIALDVASMILVFNGSLSISFRMDEKRFDVDGTYNARYEVVKKRVDKANIKGTNERITQKGKLTIVYAQRSDEVEYLRYINFLQAKKYMGAEVEILELEDLQGVTGLKAIRVPILYQSNRDEKEFYTYEDLMETIKG